MTQSPARLVAGCMTGTSLDALDAVLVRITGRGRELDARVLGHVACELGPLRDDLAQLASGESAPAQAYLRAAHRLGELHADAVAALCARHLPGGEALSFVAAHGQTICHLPGERLSWQLLNPWPIVRALGVPVVHDLRQADLVAGGQGAPITPIADPILYRDRAQQVFNLGGICNHTRFDGQAIAGGDVTVCNLLLDGLCQRLTGERFDRDGRLAGGGQRRDASVARIETSIDAAVGAACTLGREQFNDAWLEALAQALGDADAGDVLASAAEAIARRVVAAGGPGAIALAGGGARNAALVAAIRRLGGGATRWRVSDELGVAAEVREAAAMAVLGALCADGVPITLGSITGADRPGVAGTWALSPTVSSEGG